MNKLEKLESLLKIASEGLTRKEFETSFQVVMKLILQAEERHQILINKYLEDFSTKIDSKVARIKYGKDSTVPGPQGERGKDGKDGADGKSIVGPAGKDGSPDSKEQVRDKLEELKDGEKLSIQAIQDLSEKLEELGKIISSGVRGQKYGS